MHQPPPRKVKPTTLLKTLHSEHCARLQAKYQQECDLLEDIKTFAKQRSIIEKEYGQALQKLTSQLLKRDFQAMPDLPSVDGQEQRTVMAVWRVILEETDKLAKKRVQASETYLEMIAEPVKTLKANQQQIMKKVAPQLTQIQAEVSHSVAEMCKVQKAYNLDEAQAFDAREKAKEAEQKLSRKNKGMFQSLSSLQKNYAKLRTKLESCEAKSTSSRNDYLLYMVAANAHQLRYFQTDLPNIMEVLDGEMFDLLQKCFTVYGKTANEISCLENKSFSNIVNLAAMINYNCDLKCFLYTNRVFTELVQYEFQPCLQDQCNKISRAFNAAHQLDKEARKWASRIAKENKVIKEFQKCIQALGTADKVCESVSSEAISQDSNSKLEDYQQHIRLAETAKAKAEARIEALRQAGVNVDEWLSSANVESLNIDEESELHSASSRISIQTDSSGLVEDHEEPLYSNYDDDEEYIQYNNNSNHHSSPYPLKCKSMYEFHAANPDELDLAENEELEILGEGEGDGWIRARNSQGQYGVIPENYIVLVAKTTNQPCDLWDNGFVDDGLWVRALYDYEGTTDDELSFQEGALIKVLHKGQNGIDDGFWEGEVNGRIGAFPSLVVEELTSLRTRSQTVTRKKSYSRNKFNTLSLRK